LSLALDGFFLCISATFAREATPIARESWSCKKEGIMKLTGERLLLPAVTVASVLPQPDFSLKLRLVGQHQTHVEEMHGSAGCSQF
jgi:hypothetical protein